MTLRLPDKWVWDFWFARREGEWHIFYLQAPRALGDPALRHHNASIGHAVSFDCRKWQVVADAVRPGPPGGWDDLATWTGSVLEHDGRWHMMYTGISSVDNGLIQRIGLATSDDLVHWTKHEANPVLEADPTWYELLDLKRWRDQSWRDPFLFRHPGDDLFHVLITARTPSESTDGAGVIAHARSHDLINWEVMPPLTQPGEFAQVEVPQLIVDDEGCRILFSCHAEDHSNQRVQRIGERNPGGTFVYFAKDFEGPYTAADYPVVAASDGLGVLYAGKVFDRGNGGLEFMAFHGDNDNDFVGELTDPLPIKSTGDGGLVVVSEE